MGFLDQFRKDKNSDIHEQWKTIASEADLAKALQTSHEKTVVLFKHSVTCGISAGAKYGLEQDWDFTPEDLTFYYLDLLSYRSISNKIAEDLGVTHQSPQVIVVKDGKAVYNVSHHGINNAAIRKQL